VVPIGERVGDRTLSPAFTAVAGAIVRGNARDHKHGGVVRQALRPAITMALEALDRAAPPEGHEARRWVSLFRIGSDGVVDRTQELTGSIVRKDRWGSSRGTALSQCHKVVVRSHLHHWCWEDEEEEERL